jgi:hypothetical protein
MGRSVPFRTFELTQTTIRLVLLLQCDKHYVSHTLPGEWGNLRGVIPQRLMTLFESLTGLPV